MGISEKNLEKWNLEITKKKNRDVQGGGEGMRGILMWVHFCPKHISPCFLNFGCKLEGASLQCRYITTITKVDLPDE